MALPVLAAGGYTVVQQVDGQAADPIDPVDSSSVYQDTDRDGLPNLLENYVYGTNASNPTTSSSVVPDGYLARNGYDPADPNAEEKWTVVPPPGETPDAWGPGRLPDSQRVTVKELYLWNRPDGYDENESGPWNNGLDPEVWKSPSGLPVPWLLTHDLDPLDANVSQRVLAPEPDGDGLTVGESYRTATDPRAIDTDGDGLDDDREIEEIGTDPSAFSTAGGGVADGWAVRYALNASDARMPFRDPDNDGLSNAREYNASVRLYGPQPTLNGSGLDPTRRSTGDAPIPDGWLVREGLDPRAAGVAQRPLSCASDYDVPRDTEGLEDVCHTVLDAYLYERPQDWEESERGPWMGGLSARTNDTDGDGIPDPVEIRGWHINVSNTKGNSGGQERTHVTPDPLAADTDGDDLEDQAEFLGRATVDGRTVTFNVTDPENRDTDFDGLPDGQEILVVSRALSRELDQAATLDPTRRDTDGDALEDGREWFTWRDRAKRCRSGEATYGFGNPTSSLRTVLDGIATDNGVRLDGETELCDLLEPWGDPDGDGAANILDQDSDDDNLWDGWESVPENYAQSPWASPHPRSRTDPINPDSDGDGLPDGWEVKFGRWNQSLQSFNLDPAAWSSFRDDTSDAQRDLDHDSITWLTFHRKGGQLEAKEHTFEATNLVEYRNGTDPNLASTPDTELLDGWTIFWGRVYPNLDADAVGDAYPGAPGPFFIPSSAPKPDPLAGEDEVTNTETIRRFSTSRDAGSGASLVRVFENVQTADGETRTVYLFERTVRESFSFNQEHATNPYMTDTDMDGAADAWEAHYDGPSPVAHAPDSDTDEDGLPLQREASLGTDPTSADTDLGGAEDGEEVDAGRSPLDPSDDASVSDPDADLDCDGVSDAREADGWSHPSLGEITTNPVLPDMDRDGLLDGFTRDLDPETDASCVSTLEANGVLHEELDDGTLQFLGEADTSHAGDPRLWSTARDGVPDGYRVWWGFKATDEPSHVVAAYKANRPSWWSESSMGPWMWGPAPIPGSDVDGDGQTDWATEGARFVLQDADLDEDGLNDANGEDPTPGARPSLVPPEGRPDDGGLTDKERRSRAAQFGIAQSDRDQVEGRDVDGDGVPDAYDQLPALVRDLRISGVNLTDGRYQLSQTRSYTLEGRVLADPGDESPVPVPNATVVAELVDHEHPVGASFTDADGRFSMNVSFSGDRELAVPWGHVLFGRTDETVTLSPNVDDLPMGAGSASTPNVLRAWVTNTSGAATPGDATHLGVPGSMETGEGGDTEAVASGIAGTVSDTLPVSLVTTSELSLSVPSEAAPGTTIPVEARLTNAGGDALPNETIQIDTPSGTLSIETDVDGRARANVTLPTEVGPFPVQAAFDGGAFTQPDSAAQTVTAKHPSEVHLTSIDPSPPIAGRNVTIEGRLVSEDDVGGRTINVSTPASTRPASTRPDGTFGLTLPWPASAVGDRTIAARFAGTDAILSDDAQVQVTGLGGAELTLSTPEGSLAPGASFSLRARLTDPTGDPLPDEIVRVSGFPNRDPVDLRTDATGLADVEVEAPPRPGAWSLSAAFAGTETRAPDRAFGWLNVSTPILLNVDAPDRVTRGSVVPLSGTLRTPSGASPGAQPVDVNRGSEPIGTTVTKPDGTFQLDWTVPSSAPLGSTQIEARFNGSADGRYQVAEGGTTTVIREGLQITPRTLELQRGSNPITLEVRLDSGRPAPEGVLELGIPSLGIERQVRVTDARARYTVDVGQQAPLGDHPARVRYDPQGGLRETVVNTTATVVTPVRIQGLSGTAVRGDDLTVAGRVESVQAAQPPSGTLHASFLGEHRNVTVHDGRFNLTLPVPEDVDPGEHPLEVEWPRQLPFLGAADEGTITVREPVEIVAELSPGRSGEPVRGTVTVRTADGEPVSGESVLLQKGEDLAYLVETNDRGRADVVLPPPDQNGSEYRFHFAGRGTLATATTQSSVSAPATPASIAPWQWAGVTALVLLAVVGGATWYLKRRQEAMAASVADELEEGRRRLEAGSEYEAVIVHAYRTFVDLVADREVEIEDPDTLREYQGRIERVLGIRGSAVEDLFTVFEESFYGPAQPGPAQRNRAIAAFHRVTRLLRDEIADDEEIA